MRWLWLGMTVFGLLYGPATAGDAGNDENGIPLYDRPIYNDELSVALPKDWRLVRSEAPGIMKYDDLLYYVQVADRRLFAIDLTNNDNFRFPDDTTTTNVTNNGIGAREYRQGGVLTNVFIKAPCGGFRYVMMWFVTQDPGERRQVEASMKSIKCLASPRPSLN
ncbi:MAG: hypothetical protein QOF71_3067 [Candidatus Eremiobacteraeota bacterium]|jgi:hypothetical protein|nr:hypothetical protein [Candidatus Eremiobacteraeota bacterium]